MNTQTRQYKQLTLGQRYQIQALRGKGHNQKNIAAAVDISESVLSRELSRNSSDDGYCAEKAHAMAIQRKVFCRRMTADSQNTVQ